MTNSLEQLLAEHEAADYMCGSAHLCSEAQKRAALMREVVRELENELYAAVTDIAVLTSGRHVVPVWERAVSALQRAEAKVKP